MNYKDKVKLAKNAILEIENGKSFLEIENRLLSEGFYPYDIDKVILSIKNILQQNYEASIKSSILNKTFDENIKTLPKLENGVLDFLKKQAIVAITKDIRANIIHLIKKEKSNDEIIQEVGTDYLNRDEILSCIDHYKRFNEAPKDEVQRAYIAKGAVFIIIGLIYFTIKWNLGRITFLGISFVLLGIWNLYKAFTPLGVVEMSDLDGIINKRYENE